MDNDCYDTKFVSSTSGPGNTDERQNFANWYSFYRTRYLATASGASLAFDSLDSDSRVAWQALNTCRGSTSSLVDTSCDGWTSTYGSNAIGNFTGTKKTNFYNWLARIPTSGGTPLREAMIRAGEYFKTSGENSPYDNDLSAGSSGEHACRKNFHILMTDGIWNDDVSVGNVDNTNIAHLPDEGDGNPIDVNGTPYDITATYARVFKDSYSSTLADVAFEYWSTDLRNDLTDNVPQYIGVTSGTDLVKYWNPKNDPASWQHMVNYTIGVGLSDFLAAAGLTWAGDTYSGSYADLVSGATTWPAATAAMGSAGSDYGKSAHDLWHAAINSRGKFYSAESPDEIVTAFQSILDTISSVADSGGGAGLSSNTTQINQEGATVFEAKFNADWSGLLLARPIQTGGSLGEELWDAGQKIPAPSARKILTVNGGSKESFETCDDDLADALNRYTDSEGTIVIDGNCQKRLNWFRGDPTISGASWASNVVTFTANGHYFVTGDSVTVSDVVSSVTNTTYNGTFTVTGTTANTFSASLGTNPGTYAEGGRARYALFRDRANSVLGDIMNSDPFYTHKEDFGYGGGSVTLNGHDTYSDYVKSQGSYSSGGKTNRLPVIYVGANDGMLHAFQADISETNSGQELFAFVPGGVYDHLSQLTYSGYTHRFYVDGPPSLGDVYIGGGWKTYLVGGLGAGGRSIYALDVTDPANVSTTGSGPSNLIKWEYTHSDLGLTYSQPLISPTTGSQWAAIFGNGYNSDQDKAFLFVVNLETGALISKIATNNDTSNGLSTPYLYDSDGDKIVDVVYAGDLRGNLWKFVNTSGAWSLGNGGNPLFTATNAGGDVQSITSQPKVAAHPNGGVLVYFGTGRYLVTDDLTDDNGVDSFDDAQSFYAIWDKDGVTGTVTRADLQVQTILNTLTEYGHTLRTTSSNTPDWTTQRGWYMDLPATDGSPSERIISTPLVMEFVSTSVPDRVLFVTNTPSSDPCSRGGTTWLMELALITGSRTSVSVFDFRGADSSEPDEAFDEHDTVSDGGEDRTVSGIALPSTYGITGEPLLLDTGTGQIIKEFSGSTGVSGTAGGPTQSGEPPTPGGAPVRIYWQQLL